MQPLRVGVVGATGAVGQELLLLLEQREFPLRELMLLASSRSAGQQVSFRGQTLVVKEADAASFTGLDLVFFSAGSDTSLALAPEAVKAGCVVVDNSNAFRMDERVPLVVPEVNPQSLSWHQGLIANPNCSTIQMVVALHPLHQTSSIQRIIVSTYQAVSGTGQSAVQELWQQSREIINGGEPEARVYPHVIAFNLLPHIDKFDETGYTGEEWKMVHETRKIMEEPEMRISATTVRVPVVRGHSESVAIETRRKLTPEQARAILSKAPGVELMDDSEHLIYPTPRMAAHTDPVLVGRIREDFSVECGLQMWVVADNLRKGAALNAIQIGEALVAGEFL